MQFPDQHIEAIRPTVRVQNAVTASIFDDKVKDMGTVKVENGKITIDLNYLPGMNSGEATGEFLADSIKLGILACWKARPEAFEQAR
jgi:hypothetical protein